MAEITIMSNDILPPFHVLDDVYEYQVQVQVMDRHIRTEEQQSGWVSGHESIRNKHGGPRELWILRGCGDCHIPHMGVALHGQVTRYLFYPFLDLALPLIYQLPPIRYFLLPSLHYLLTISIHYLILHLILHTHSYTHREFEELSAKGEKVGERAREQNIQQAASQNKSSDTSCMEDLEGDGEGEGEGAEMGMMMNNSSDRNSEKETEKDDKDKDGHVGLKSDPNCV